MQHRVYTLVRTIRPTLHKESRPRFNSNQVFLLEQELKSPPKAFILGVKAETEKIFSICPKLLINAKLYGLVLAPRLKKGYQRIWAANLQPLGTMFQQFLIS
jgi:hypothetical protein